MNLIVVVDARRSFLREPPTMDALIPFRPTMTPKQEDEGNEEDNGANYGDSDTRCLWKPCTIIPSFIPAGIGMSGRGAIFSA